MSLVTMIASINFISFVSDGRVIDNEKNQILFEDYKKITKVNDKIIFSVTGDFNASKIINKSIDCFCRDNAMTFAHSMFDVLGNNQLNKGIGILIGGIEETGKIYFTGFQNDSTELVEKIPGIQGIYHAVTFNDITEKLNPQLLLKKYIELETIGIDSQKAFDIQKKFNDEISTIDKTVNKITYQEFIVK